MDLNTFGLRKDFDFKNRIVKQENLKLEGEEYCISTIDLGIDHSRYGGVPLYFETMIFKGGMGDVYCQRYSTRKEAMDGHLDTLKGINNGDIRLIDDYFENV
jgi:hypothetical protein